MRSFTMKTKLFGGFAFLLIVILVISAFGIRYLAEMNSRLNGIADISCEKIKLAARINQGVLAVSRAEKNIILAATREEMDRYARFAEEVRKDMQERREKLRELADKEGGDQLDAFAKTWDEYLKVHRELRSVARHNSNVRARTLSQGEAREAHEKAAETLQQIAEMNDAALEQTAELKELRANAEKVRLTARISRNLVEIHRGEKNIILARTQEEMDQYARGIKEVRTDMDQRITRLESLLISENQPLLRRFQRELDTYFHLHEQVRKLSSENANTRAFALSKGKARELSDKALEQMAAIVEKNERDLQHDKLASDKNYSEIRIILILLVLSGLIFGMGVALWIVPGFNRSLNQALLIANAMARGDTTKDVEVFKKDEVGMLLIAMQRMTVTLRELGAVAERISEGDLGTKVDVKGKNDLVAKSVNRMVDRFAEFARQADVIAAGDYSADIAPRSENDMLGIAMGRMTLTLREVGAVAERISEGDLGTKVDVKGKNDLVAKSVNQMVDNFAEFARQADAIAMGDYSANIAPRSENDVLGSAMRRMTQTLREVGAVAESVSKLDLSKKVEVKGDNDLVAKAINRMVDNFAEFVRQNEREDWLKTGQNQLNDQMRGDPDEKKLADNVITFLAGYLNAQIGTLYLAEEESDTLRLAGSYAFARRKELGDRIKIGEGLAGQAAYEKKMISVTGIPEDYTRIRSATGDAMPNNIVIAPFLLEGQLIGVIELGAFHEFSDRETDLLNNVMESVALSFNSVRNRMRTNELLGETQRQAEEVESQAEELKAANEELEQQSREMESLNEELEEKAEALEVQKEDIEQKNREVEEKAEELAIASKYKSEFLANMSHELRTPLNSLLLLSAGLSRNRERNLTPEQVESVTIIHNGGKELLQLIDEILDLSKIEAGMMETDFRSVPVREIAGRMGQKFGHMAEAKGLELKISTDQDLPDSIVTDRNRLDQILTNLLSNAIKFTSKGSVTVDFSQPGSEDAGKFLRSGLKPEETVAIAVTDTGIGIPPGKKQVIFEAFQQAEGGTARKYGGTGLGLSISRELATLLGGEIRVRSIVGEGSAFTLLLPVAAKPPSQAEERKRRERPAPMPEMRASEISEADTSAKSIQDDRENLGENDTVLLIIEDDLKFAEILLNQCRDRGFKCLATPNGSDGLELAVRHLPSGIILDLHLPDMDGRSVLTALKENTATRHIPVHIISADERNPDALRQGAVGFLTKPVSQEQLDGIFLRFREFADKDVKDLLVVEDDEPTRKAVTELIGNSDVRITGVASGQEAFKLFQSASFDCMILDLKLPDMSGFELLDRLRQEKEIRIPPVIVHTGRELTEEEHHYLLEYTESVVIKGVRSQERLLDETALFLHRIVGNLSAERQKMIRQLYDPEYLFKDKKVLAVDDDIRNLFALTRLLQEQGMEVLRAEDGQKALKLLETESDVSLVLTDIMMPGMDGYELIRRIRKQKQFRELPVIALTAKAMKEDRAKCIAAGASDYIAKPVDEQRLFSMMRVWLYQ
ncbi:response regulator [Desulfobacterales bacterium HSG2]|nr:response regulator [Desulfobacterales bacterium HSG2]